MANYYLSDGKYGGRHTARAKEELLQLATKAALTKKVEPVQALGHKPEKAAGFYVTFQYLEGVQTETPHNVRVFVWGNSRKNALYLALKLPVVRQFVEMAADNGYLVDSFINPSGLINAEQPEGLISKQGW